MALSDVQLALLASNSFKHSGAPSDIKAAAEHDIQLWLAKRRKLKPWVAPVVLAGMLASLLQAFYSLQSNEQRATHIS